MRVQVTGVALGQDVVGTLMNVRDVATRRSRDSPASNSARSFATWEDRPLILSTSPNKLISGPLPQQEADHSPE